MVLGLSTVPVSAASAESAESAVASITAGWNLGNALDSCGDWIAKYTDGKPDKYETAWGNPVTKKSVITAIKKAGFNAVRVPVTWDAHIDSKGNIDSEWLARVKEVVDYVISQDMYCILNVHHDAGSDGWLEASESAYEKNKTRFAGLWKNIATEFKSYDDKLIFEGFNEMLDKNNSWTSSKDSGAYTAINNYNQLFVDTVRKTGGNNKTRNLMVQPYSGDGSENQLKKFKLPEDTVSGHLIVQVHNYDPQGFTSSTATWTTMTDKWGTDSEKKNVDTYFARLKKYSDSLGAPFVVGEFGAEYKKNDSERVEYASCFVTTAAKYGVKCFWWDTGEMALINRNTGKITHSEVVKALTSVKASTSSSSGKDKDTSSGKLAAPTVTAKAGSGSVKLSWNEIDGADAYRVYMYDSETGKYKRIVTVRSNYYTVKKLESGTYKFIVAAVTKTSSGYKNGEYSKSVKAVVK